MIEDIWSQYGLTQEEWEELTEDEKNAYLAVGTDENASGLSEQND